MKQYYNVKNYARTPEIRELPSLIDIQKASFEDFFYGGKLKELFDEINPIKSFNQNLSLYFPGNDPDSEEFDFKRPPADHHPCRLLNTTQSPKKGLQIYMQEPKYDEDECIERDMSFAAPLYVQVAMVNHEQGDEIIRQPIFLGEFPLMTEKGTFIINGTERVVVSQLIRSPGVYFDAEDERATGRKLANAKLIPDRGAWMEFETKKTDYITIKFNRKRTIPVTILLRALAAVEDGLPKSKSPIKTGEDAEILKLFADVDDNETHRYIESSFRNEPDWQALQKKYDTKNIAETALVEFFTRMRPGDPQKLPAAREYLVGQLFDQRRYDLERVGRYKLNQRLGLEGEIDLSKRTITKSDIVKLVEQMIIINNGGRAKDDIDHLGNRRVKTVGELIGNKLRIGLRRMERVVKERMSIREAEQLTPVSLVNIRPIVAAVREFFGSSQLSQFMEQTNPLSELTHKRTLSALGPGGLRRERAGFDVRDVHHSHYGRICPIETPEGPNIGLIGRLASYARVNDLGFIETPYRKVVNALDVDDPRLPGKVLDQDLELRINPGTAIDETVLSQLRQLGVKEVLVETQTKRPGVKSAKVVNALAGEELAEDAAWTKVVPAGALVDDELLGELRESDCGEIEARWTPPAQAVPIAVSDAMDGMILAEPVVVVSSMKQLARLCRAPALERTKAEFDALADQQASNYAHDDAAVFQLRGKGETGARQTCERFMESYKARYEATVKVLDDIVESRDLVANLLKQLLDDDATNDTLRQNAENYLNSLKSVQGLRQDCEKNLRLLGNAVTQFLESDAEEVPQNIRSRISTYGKAVCRLPRRFDSLRTDLESVVEKIEALQGGDASSVVARLEQLESSAAYQSSTEAFEELYARATGQQLSEDQELLQLRFKEVRDSDGIAQRFLDSVDERIAEVERVLTAYAKAREPIADILKTQDPSLGERYAKNLVVAETLREDCVKWLRNLAIAAEMYVAADENDKPENIRRRIKRWCDDLVSFPQRLTPLRSSLHQATGSIESFGDIDPVLMDALTLEAGAVLHSGILEILEHQGVGEVVTVREFSETVGSHKVDGELLGKTVAKTIELQRVVFTAGERLTRADVDRLREFGIKSVQVVVELTDTADILRAVDESLIGEKVAADTDYEWLIVDEGELIDADVIATAKRYGIPDLPVVPFATHEMEYLSADREDKFIIAQANAELDDRGQFVNRRVSARHDQGFLSVAPQRIQYMDVAPRQIVGISAALIPFLSHDAANRALMGSNMQRQAVPLLTPDVSVVSTGMERQAASDSGQVLVSEIEAEVISVQGHRVIARRKDGVEETFQLRKYERSNQSTCIDQRPVVRKGDWIKPGDVIADSSSTYDGHLALGHDVLTCFLSWDGGNYEDALLVSEDMLRNDKFTSIHIEKHEIEARDTKLGAEEITYDIPNVGEEALKDLDEHGIVRIGAEVGPNDILVGKITPKGEKELSPEEKLLRAIFGEQAREVKDSSLRLPHGDRGKVIDVKVFTRDEHPDLPAGVEKMVRVSVAQRRKLTVGDKMAGRHGNKGVISKIVSVADMPYIDGGVPCEVILNPLGVPSRMNIGQILELHLGWAADRMGFRAITPVFDGVKEHEIQAELGRAWMIDWAWRAITRRAWENQARLADSVGMEADEFQDDLDVIRAFLSESVGAALQLDIQEKVTELADEREDIIKKMVENHLRRVAVTEVLSEHGYDPAEIMVYDNSELSAEERDVRDLKALEISLRLWIEQTAQDEVALAQDLTLRELFAEGERVMFATGRPLPHYGKHTLYDGRTGEPFDRPVAVGYVHMLKLAHLVEDKAHARSTGPYSLVTQQPLGGKAQFGGQRFGEMEVWALEAYGAAHILQEMLTVKSDDVQGRVKTYESIVKGEPIEEPGIPTSFRVLVKELQSLGLSVEAITGAGDVIRFGKYDEQSRRPQPETGLLGLGAR